MTTLVLFHHVLGLTHGVMSLAHALRDEGVAVLTPDLFEGTTFCDIPSGLEYVSQMSDDELLQRAEQLCSDLPHDVVYGGLSWGAVPAQHLLQTRPGAAGAILLHSFIDPAQLAGTWPQTCPVDVFAMDNDPYFAGDGDLAAARAWQRDHDNLRIHLYPGAGHLFMEPSLQDYDEVVTRTVTQDVIAAMTTLENS